MEKKCSVYKCEQEVYCSYPGEEKEYHLCKHHHIMFLDAVVESGNIERGVGR